MSKSNADILLEKLLGGRFEKFKNPDKIPTQYWVVLIDGQRVVMNSGKALWKQIGHAKVALKTHIDAIWDFQLRNTISYQERQEAIQKWINAHAEFITLDEWKKRLIS